MVTRDGDKSADFGRIPHGISRLKLPTDASETSSISSKGSLSSESQVYERKGSPVVIVAPGNVAPAIHVTDKNESLHHHDAKATCAKLSSSSTGNTLIHKGGTRSNSPTKSNNTENSSNFLVPIEVSTSRKQFMEETDKQDHHRLSTHPSPSSSPKKQVTIELSNTSMVSSNHSERSTSPGRSATCPSPGSKLVPLCLGNSFRIRVEDKTTKWRVSPPKHFSTIKGDDLAMPNTIETGRSTSIATVRATSPKAKQSGGYSDTSTLSNKSSLLLTTRLKEKKESEEDKDTQDEFDVDDLDVQVNVIHSLSSSINGKVMNDEFDLIAEEKGTEGSTRSMSHVATTTRPAMDKNFPTLTPLSIDSKKCDKEEEFTSFHMSKANLAAIPMRDTDPASFQRLSPKKSTLAASSCSTTTETLTTAAAWLASHTMRKSPLKAVVLGSLHETKCPGCYMTILPSDSKVQVETDVIYHRTCFKCETCSLQLNLNTFFRQGDQLFCRIHASI